MLSAFFATIGVLLAVALVTLLVAVCLFKGGITGICWVITQFRNAFRGRKE